MLGLILAAALSAAPVEEASAKATFDNTLKLDGTLMRVGAPIDAEHAPQRFEVQLQATGLIAVADGKGGVTVTHVPPGAGADAAEPTEAHTHEHGEAHTHSHSHSHPQDHSHESEQREEEE